MDVAPGEIIHMDENGAVKFPASRMAEVLENVQQLVKEEGELQEKIMKSNNRVEVRSAFRGEEYSEK